MKKKPISNNLFEVSFEVCNRVGGIYRVLESKAKRMVQHYGDSYFLIGPYFPQKAKGEFKEEATPKELKPVFQKLQEEGITCYYGRWMVEGKPKTILVEVNGFFNNIDNIKKELWDNFGVDSINAGHDFNEPVCWSYVTGKIINEIASIDKKKKTTAHFHEWLCGAGLLYLKQNKSSVRTVFTTHATTLGRSLAFHSVNFYPILKEINITEEVNKMGIQAKHSIERAAAVESDIFTTVSEITALEAEHFLGRKPDIVLPNGLDMDKYLTFEEVVIKHRIQRRRLRRFVASYFFPYYTFDIEKTLFYFLIGRNEFKAKGVDVFIRSLGKLNEKMRKAKSEKTIIAFLFVPVQTKGINPSLLENMEYFRDIQESLDSVFPEMQERVSYSLIRGTEINKETLISEDYLLEIDKKLLRMNRKGEVPSLCTHHLAYPHSDIIDALKEAELLNKEEDNVKVVFYPTYLTGHDGLSNLSYDEALEACHLGVFPSFYEPWGYTPLEAAALGVSSVTTDLSGFGRFCNTLEVKKKTPGIYVLEREKKEEEEAVEDLFNFMYAFSKLSRQERVLNKIEARKIAAKANWENFVLNYIEAHNDSQS